MTNTRFRITSLAALLALTLVAVPALAGDGEKCDRKTDADHVTKTAEMDETAKAEKVAAYKKAGWAGMEVEQNADGRYVVEYVLAGGPAAQAGIAVGDHLVSYAGIEISDANMKKIKAAKSKRAVGGEVEYGIERGGDRRTVAVELIEVPDTVLARWLGQLDGAPAGERVASTDG